MAQEKDMTGVLVMSKADWRPHVASFLITVASIWIITLLWRKIGALPSPEVLLLLTVAVTTYIAGGMAGMLSAGIVLFSSFVMFSNPSALFRYSEMDWRQAMLIVVASPLIALMVGSLKEQVERLRVVTRDNDHLMKEVERLQRVNSRLHLCEERFRLAADSIKDHAVVVLDATGSVKTWNAGAEAITGYNAQEIVGQSYSRFFTKDDILARQPDLLLERAQFSGRVEDTGWRLTKSGPRFRTSTAISPVKTDAGQVIEYLMVISDLSERLR